MKKIVKVPAFALLMFFQLYAVLYHMGAGNRWWVIIVIIAYPVYLLDRKFISYWQDENFVLEKKVKNLVIAFGLSVLFYIGLFFIYINSFTIQYINALIGYISFLFVLLFVLSCAANGIGWKEKGKKNYLIVFALYFLIPASVYTVGLLACYPGMLSPDSLYVWSQVVHDGLYDNLHPILYTLLLRLMYVCGLDIFGVMIIQCLAAAFIYTYIAYRFNRMGLNHMWCIAGLVLLTLYPANLFNTLTFWKDIPYTLGLSLLLVLVSRHNGIFVVVGTLVISALIFAFKRDKKRALTSIVTALISIVVYYGARYGSIALLGEKYQEPEDNKVTLTAQYALRMQGMVTLYAEKWDAVSDEDKAFIEEYIDLEELDAHLIKFNENDMWQYWSRTKVYANTDLLESDPKSFNAGYLRLLKEYPYDMITSYIKTTAIIWCAPQAGYTSHSAHPYAFRDAESTEKYDISINNITYLPKVKEFIYNIYTCSPDKAWYAILWRPAIFMLGILFFLWQAVKRKGTVAWIVAMPALLNSIGYFVIIEAQDARYGYINFTVCLIMAGVGLMKDSEKNQQRISPAS